MNDMSGINGRGPDDAARFQRTHGSVAFPGALPRSGMQKRLRRDRADNDLFTACGRLVGLPIGNLTSQLWANLYLDRLDHVIKEKWRVSGYARYTDDFLLWSDDKSFLHDCRTLIADELQNERLLLHPVKSRVIQCREGVPFLGFRFFPGRRPRLAAESKRRFEKRSRQQMRDLTNKNIGSETVRASMLGWCQFAHYGNVDGLFRLYKRNGFAMGQAGT